MGIASQRYLLRMPDLLDAGIEDILHIITPLLDPSSAPAKERPEAARRPTHRCPMSGPFGVDAIANRLRDLVGDRADRALGGGPAENVCVRAVFGRPGREQVDSFVDRSFAPGGGHGVIAHGSLPALTAAAPDDASASF